MKMAAFGLDEFAHAAVVVRFPFGRQNKRASYFLEASQHMSISLHGRVFERQYMHVVIVQLEVVPVAFHVGVASLEVNEGVISEASTGPLERRIVEQVVKEAERQLLIEDLERDAVAELNNEAIDLVREVFFCQLNLSVHRFDMAAIKE